MNQTIEGGLTDRSAFGLLTLEMFFKDFQNGGKAKTHLNAVPSPCGDRPSPNGDEKKSSSMPPIDENKLLWWSKMLSESKNELKGLLVPKNDSKVALGSPWNSYVKFELLLVVPFDLSAKRREREAEKLINVAESRFPRECYLLPFNPSSPYLS